MGYAKCLLGSSEQILPDNMFLFVVQQWSKFIEFSMIIIRHQKLMLCQHIKKMLNVALESNFRLGVTSSCVHGTSARPMTPVTSSSAGVPIQDQ